MERSVLERVYLESAVVQKGDYPYFINSISDGNPPVTKELLDEITDRFLSLGDLDCDIILAPEAMGIQYAAALTLRTGIPFQVIRKRGHGLPGEIAFHKDTGYEGSEMYMNFVEPGTRAILVDDVISTGGTLKATVRTLREHGIVIDEALIILNKSSDISSLMDEIGIRIRTLMDVAVRDGRPVIR